MKKIIYLLIFFSLSILLLSMVAKPIIVLLAKRQLSKIFIDSSVGIGACNFNPFSRLSLLNIEIRNKQIYDFKIRELEARYGLLSIMRRNLSKFSLRDAVLSFNAPQESIKGLSGYFGIMLGRPWLINSLECANVKLNFVFRELRLNGLLSTELDLAHQQFNHLKLNIDSLSFGDFSLAKGFLEAVRAAPDGIFSVSRIKFGKLRIENLKGAARLKGSSLFIDSLFAELLGGSMQGSAILTTEPAIEYRSDLKFKDLDLEAFVKDFDLGNKFELSGKMNGRINLEGNVLSIRILDGDFTALAPGGMFVIKDRDYLENLARNSNQSTDLLVESFKNYYYNTGTMDLSLDKGNLVMDIVLDGKTGRRNLAVVLHILN